mmetsp:Transcript_56883/g.149846  ORF Transcript_56883/g.149846 Transcript_56883/m.149846 type:complete len:94 (-) Transcript_56883:63-344(-)
MYTNRDGVIKLLVGNKIDKANREVTRAEGIDFARSRGMLFIECSAKAKTGIQQAFSELVQKIMDSPHLSQQEGSGLNINRTSTAAVSGSYCAC